MTANESTGPLTGLTAWITGGSSGIGAESVRQLTAAGASVAVLDLAEPPAGGEWERCDIGDPSSVADAADALISRGGVPDILVNNAGISVLGSIAETTDAQWRRTIDINLSGAFYVTRAVFPAMCERGSGAVITIGSVTAVSVGPARVAYATTKAGLLGLSRAIAAEGAASGVTSNVVAPGLTETPMSLGTFGSREALGGYVADSHVSNPMRVILEPDDIASAVLFFALPSSRHITGQVLHVSGGAWMP